MAYLYVVRHAQAEPVGSYCVGCGTDESLTPQGRLDAAGLYRCFRGMPQAPVYTSPLKRSQETAQLLAGPQGQVLVCPDLRELAMGSWEGKSFGDIRREYPDLYEARGTDHSLQPPGGESYPEASLRMERALTEIASGLGDLEERVVVSHSGAMRAFLCKITNTPYQQNRQWAQPHCSVNVLEYSQRGWTLLLAGGSPHRCPDQGTIQALWDQYGAGESARHHCCAVAEKAVSLCRELNAHGLQLNEELIRTAALLHDLRRQEKHHPQAAARLLRRNGFFQVAAVVAAHEGPEDHPQLNEEGVLYLADKQIAGQQEVSIQERFAKSREKCTTPEAVEQHTRRLKQALRLEELCRAQLEV